MNFGVFLSSHLLFLASPSGEHADAISRKKKLVFRFNEKKKKNDMKNQKAQFDPSHGCFFFLFFMFYEIDIPVVKATWGGRWRTARTGKSCVKPVATADLFNPAVREWSTQIGIHTRGDNCLDFPTFCVLQPFGFDVGVSGRGKAGEMDSPLCGVSVVLLSGSGGMQRSRNLGCTLPYAAHFLLHYFR